MERVQVSISKNLYEEIKRRFSTQCDRFEGIDEYIEYMLSYALNSVDPLLENKQEQVKTSNEEEEVKENLRRLGYI